MKTFEKKPKGTVSPVRRRRTPVLPSFDPAAQIQRAHIRQVLRPPRVQAKLTIGQPNDKYEQEADRVADEVMRMPEPRLQRQAEEKEEAEELIQAKPLVEQITPLVQRQVEPEEEEEEEEEEILQAKDVSGKTPEVTPDLESRIHALKGGGQSLPESTRSFFEPRFGYDFGQVCIHTGISAATTARAINGHAFTVGRNIVFARGQYAPESISGKHLMAHELTHIIQQEGGSQTKFTAAQSEGKYEQENGQVIHRQMITQKGRTPDNWEILRMAGLVLRGKSVEQALREHNRPKASGRYLEMLTDFLWARFGSGSAKERWIKMGARERRYYLSKGLWEAKNLIEVVKESGMVAESWIQEEFWGPYCTVRDDIKRQEAEEKAEALIQRGVSESAPDLTIIDVLEAADLGVKLSRQLDRLQIAYIRYKGPELEAQWKTLTAKATLPPQVEKIRGMSLDNSIVYLKGALDVVKTISWMTLDPEERKKYAQSHPNYFAVGTDILRQSVSLMEGFTVAALLVVATFCKVVGDNDNYLVASNLGSKAIRIGMKINAALSIAHGISILLDPKATAEQRKESAFELAFGLAAFAGKFVAGPITLGILLIYGNFKLIEHLASEIGRFRVNLAVMFSLGPALTFLKKEAAIIELHVSRIEVALTNIHQKKDLEASVQRALGIKLETDARNLKITLDGVIKGILNWGFSREARGLASRELQKRFEHLEKAIEVNNIEKNPEKLLKIAAETMKVIHKAFLDQELIISKELGLTKRFIKPKSVQPSSPQSPPIQLQRNLGNQAVQRLFNSGVIQAKLKIGQPNDIYEQEADGIVEQVMRMAEPVRKRKGQET